MKMRNVSSPNWSNYLVRKKITVVTPKRLGDRYYFFFNILLAYNFEVVGPGWDNFFKDALEFHITNKKNQKAQWSDRINTLRQLFTDYQAQLDKEREASEEVEEVVQQRPHQEEAEGEARIRAPPAGGPPYLVNGARQTPKAIQKVEETEQFPSVYLNTIPTEGISTCFVNCMFISIYF